MVRKIIPVLGLLFVLLAAACSGGAVEEAALESSGSSTMVVYRTPTCGCCGDWIAHVEENGYTVKVENVQNLTPLKSRYNVPRTLQSCHTAVVDGYVIEGHVPAADIERLLTERPDVAGLAVPGMPAGSPGMEVAGAAAQPFDVLTFDTTGVTEIFASYGK